MALVKAHGLPFDEPDDLAVAVASNDIAAVGRLLRQRDVNTVSFTRKCLPELLVRRSLVCSLLDVAVGSGSVEMVKYLLEFHGANPTRETLEQSIATGNLELFRMMRERLPETELRHRIDLMEVAAEFHGEEVLAWLLRNASQTALSVREREFLVAFALEGKLADSLLAALDDGQRPWWYGARELALKWRASAELEFVSAPEGFSSDCGWWRSANGGVFALSPLGSAGQGVWALPESVGRKDVMYAALPAGVMAIMDRTFRGCSHLTRLDTPTTVTAIGGWALSGCSRLARLNIPSGVKEIGSAALKGCSSLTHLEIPSNVTRIENSAFWGCSGLIQVKIPLSVTTIEWSAFRDCVGLARVEIPSGVTTIEGSAFLGCSGLTQLDIAGSVTTISDSAFSGCSGLRQLRMPSRFRRLGESVVFLGVTKLERLTLLGARLSPAVVASLKGCLSPAARLIGPALVGQKFDRFTIAAA
jgi:hypothetical protein